jgi:hypothetical protein
MLDSLPGDLTWEDIQYHIYVRQKVERAMEDVKAGKVLSQKQVEKAVRGWAKKWR